MAGEMIGLRHILEDGLKILEGTTVPAARRQYVLNEVSEFLEEAKRGSSLVRQNAWVIAPSDKRAFESFSFVDAYLGDREIENLDTSISDAERAFEFLGKGQQVPSELRQAARSLLAQLLESLAQDVGKPIDSDNRVAVFD